MIEKSTDNTNIHKNLPPAFHVVQSSLAKYDFFALTAICFSAISLLVPIAWPFGRWQSLVAFLFALCGVVGITLGMINLHYARIGEKRNSKLNSAAICLGLISIGFFLVFISLVVQNISLGPVVIFDKSNFQLGGMIRQGIDILKDNYSQITIQIAHWTRVIVAKTTNFLMFFPTWLMVFLFAALAWWISRKKGIALFTLVGLALLWNLGLWLSTMQTLVLVIFATVITVIIGLPIGIVAAIYKPIQFIVRPILDFMQTLPAFVYLIPAISFFSLGATPAIVATVIFSMPPCVRLTTLGIRQVPKDLVEAADAFGSTTLQKLIKLQLPVAAPAIRQGINQTIMLALSMVVIAAMVGAPGLGQDVWRAIQQTDIALGFNAGIGIVIMAIILDRVTQAAGTNNN